MKTPILFLILAGGPLLAFLLLSQANSKLEADWQQQLRQQYPGVTAERLASATLANVCSSAEMRRKIGGGCAEVEILHLTKNGALLTAALGILLPFLIMGAGRICDANRHMLLVLFRPGLYITNAIVCLLIALQAIVVVAALYFAEAIFMGRVYPKILLLIGLAAVVGVYSLVKASLGAIHEAKAEAFGKNLSADNYPGLWTYVRELAARVGTDTPRNLIAGLEPTFYVTEANISCVDGELSGRSLYLSLPLCRILTMSELGAIIGHELGHFKGEDTQFSLKFYPIYRGAAESLGAIDQAIQAGGTGGLSLIPAAFALNFFLDSFATAESKISRERELAADAVGAREGGGESLASGLVKVIAFSDYWLSVNEQVLRALRGDETPAPGEEHENGARFSNLSAAFSMEVGGKAALASLEGIDSKAIPHPTDSHPPLKVRLEALGLSLSSVAEKALQVKPEQPSSSVIDRCEELEAELSELQRRYLRAVNI